MLRGFQDRQKHLQQTDSPAATRPGFRLVLQATANAEWDLMHMDLKTAFLQGESFDSSRCVYCELPKEANVPWYMVARMKKPAYGLNDAPRRWWNVVDEKLRSYGLVPVRADRCTYVYYSEPRVASKPADKSGPLKVLDTVEAAMTHLLDPVTGSNSSGRKASGYICLHVDDLFMAGDKSFETNILTRIRKDFKVGSEDRNSVTFVGQTIKWVKSEANIPSKRYIRVDQNRAIEELPEVRFDKTLSDTVQCSPYMHTEYRSVLGQINWLQSRTQFHSCYKFSRAASAASKPTIGDVKSLNKVVRLIKGNAVTLNFFPLQGPLRIVGFPDASYKNNEDKSSQRAHCIFICQQRKAGKSDTFGSLVDYESHKITATTMSTTVAELHGLMRCFGTCQFIKGIWADLTGDSLELHMRTDANNLVTTASTTHVPEQKETIHLIQMLRKEASSGSMQDLAHIRSEFCLSDALTKHSAKPEELIRAVQTGVLKYVDVHPPFRTLMKHRAYLVEWCLAVLNNPRDVVSILGEDVAYEIYAAYHH